MDRKQVSLLFLGDHGVGKTTLIKSMIYESFQQNVPPILNPVIEDRNGIQTELIDTNVLNYSKTCHQLASINQCDTWAIILVCSQTYPKSIGNVLTKWLVMIQEQNLRIPIIVACNVMDNRDIIQSHYSDCCVFGPEFKECRQIEHFATLDFKDSKAVNALLETAQKIAIFPLCKLQDLNSKTKYSFHPDVINAFRRIFMIYDEDRDGYLNDTEFDLLHNDCFKNQPLQPLTIQKFRSFVEQIDPDAISEKGFTLAGFLIVWEIVLEYGSCECIWTLLRHFGYNDCFHFQQATGLPDFEKTKVYTLTPPGIEFLTDVYEYYVKNMNEKGNDTDSQLRRVSLIFSVISDSCFPWANFGYPYCTVMDENRQILPLRGFLALWFMIVFLEPAMARKYLSCLGYGYTRSKKVENSNYDLSCPITECNFSRNTFLALVFGSPSCGKSSFIRGFLEKPFVDSIPSKERVYWAVNSVKKSSCISQDNDRSSPSFSSDQSSTHLILHEVDLKVPEISNLPYLSRSNAFCVLYDNSSHESFSYAEKLIFALVSQVPSVPIVFIATKSDISPYITKNSIYMSKQLNISSPILISSKNGIYNSVFETICSESANAIYPSTVKRQHTTILLAFICSSLLWLGYQTYRSKLVKRHY
ncbi:uncharacterized protein LOC126317080 [Schistocerca gregaria]|uniref:uncharacterized protein LOC126317080 n=1 Tax=Schistocerca gregaria TaxID=7010 RepID=UPI00211F1004|nr:uncharacterized protein LOC126317080 [Schistocerca gregaria]